MLHIFCGMEWAVDDIGVIREIPSQRYTALHINTSASGCLVHDAMSAAPEDTVFANTDSYRQYCGQ